MRKVPLRGSQIFPYESSQIKVFRSEPHSFKIGQTFVLESKILGLMKDLEGNLLAGFPLKGISQLPPVKVYGEDYLHRNVLALYLPPFIEHHSEPVLIDGIHRSYICAAAGTTINSIHIYGPSVPLPFEPIGWKDSALVKEKPLKEQRYKKLNPLLFRDLSKVGIDG